MRNLFFLGLSLVCLFLSSCKDDPEEGTLTINFKAVYDEQTLPTFSTRPFENGQHLQFTNLSMYFTDIQLVQNSTVRDLRDVELVDMSFENVTAAEEGYTIKLSNIPAGAYDAIRFGIGVPPDLNAKEPSDFPSNSPLSKTGYYWVAWDSYIFSKTEGRLDTTGSGTALDLGFALHTGSDALFRSGQAPVPITIEDGQETTLDILVDYKLLLAGVDIKNNPQNHNASDTAQISKIVNNYAYAISLVLRP